MQQKNVNSISGYSPNYSLSNYTIFRQPQAGATASLKIEEATEQL
jgi:hypothetical protein